VFVDLVADQRVLRERLDALVRFRAALSFGRDPPEEVGDVCAESERGSDA
jgi:hypothetical protein